MKNIIQTALVALLLISTSSWAQSVSSNHRPAARAQPTSQKQNAQWWKETVVYQIYPRSFQDSNGDGVGDLRGIISKLDYLKSLGVGTVWLNPIYASPNDDNGYDISDYRQIMPAFGTMQDFDALLKGLHQRNIKLVMDLVVNHSSDEHEWFKQARSSRTNPYRDYYHWWPAEKGKPTPRWSFFDVNSDAWKYDSLTNSYYLHYFSRKQPDLNWENPKLRQEVYQLMRFWLDKGIDGFRMDAFQFVSKDTTFPVLPAGYEKKHHCLLRG
ncbi:alpha-amylase family glycosyl hydrolase, partial [Hymenobacter sp. AT01-02]|uniref:alpha-amylase family glycosyl hydrolase n=1 Tax=Hymenobacter sp. AT01-02 TaxID=1571877 RepID=UPI0021CDCDE3